MKKMSINNVLNFLKGKRLPSMEGMSNQATKFIWNRQSKL